MNLDGMSLSQLKAFRDKVDSHISRKYAGTEFEAAHKDIMKPLIEEAEKAFGIVRNTMEVARRNNLDYQTTLSLLVRFLLEEKRENAKNPFMG